MNHSFMFCFSSEVHLNEFPGVPRSFPGRSEEPCSRWPHRTMMLCTRPYRRVRYLHTFFQRLTALLSRPEEQTREAFRVLTALEIHCPRFRGFPTRRIRPRTLYVSILAMLYWSDSYRKSVRENGKTGSRPSRLVGNFPHFHAPAFTQRSHRNLGPVDSVSGFVVFPNRQGCPSRWFLAAYWYFIGSCHSVTVSLLIVGINL